MADASFFEDGEETNEKLGSLTQITKELAKSNSALVVLKKREVATIESNQSNLPAIIGDSQPLDPRGTPVKPTTPPVPLKVEVVGGTLDKDTGGAAGEAEEEQEADADDEERTTLLKKMTGYLGDQAKRAKRFVVGGLKAFFSTIAIGGFLIALGAFLQSPYFPKMIDYIKKEIVPKLEVAWKWLKKIGSFITDHFTELLIGLGAYFTIKGALSLYVVFKRMKTIFAGLKALQLANLATTAGGMAGGAAGGAATGGWIAKLSAKFVALKATIAGKGGLLAALGSGTGAVGLLGKLALMTGGLALAAGAFYTLYKAGQWMSDQSTKVDMAAIKQSGEIIGKGDKATDEELEGARKSLQHIIDRQANLADNENNRKVKAASQAEMDRLLAALAKRQKLKPPPTVEGKDTKDIKKEINQAFGSAAKSAKFEGTPEERVKILKEIGDKIFTDFIIKSGFRGFDKKKQAEILKSFMQSEQRMLNSALIRNRGKEGLKGNEAFGFKTAKTQLGAELFQERQRQMKDPAALFKQKGTDVKPSTQPDIVGGEGMGIPFNIPDKPVTTGTKVPVKEGVKLSNLAAAGAPQVNPKDIVKSMTKVPEKTLSPIHKKRMEKAISIAEAKLAELEKELADSQLFIKSGGAGGKDTVWNFGNDVKAERGDLSRKKSVIAKKKLALAEKKRALMQKMGGAAGPKDDGITISSDEARRKLAGEKFGVLKSQLVAQGAMTGAENYSPEARRALREAKGRQMAAMFGRDYEQDMKNADTAKLYESAGQGATWAGGGSAKAMLAVLRMHGAKTGQSLGWEEGGMKLGTSDTGEIDLTYGPHLADIHAAFMKLMGSYSTPAKIQPALEKTSASAVTPAAVDEPGGRSSGVNNSMINAPTTNVAQHPGVKVEIRNNKMGGQNTGANGSYGGLGYG